MSDPILHIKDSYYFEVPKALCPSAFRHAGQFPKVWGRNDPSYQTWEFEKTHHWLNDAFSNVPDEHDLEHDWHHWQHAPGHVNAGKPFWRYLEETHAANEAGYQAWKAEKLQAAAKAKKSAEGVGFSDYAATKELPQEWFSAAIENPVYRDKWQKEVKSIQNNSWEEYVATNPKWDQEKIDAYNNHLSGKILIPQPLGTLSNLYERESGVTLSKFVIVELGVALVLIVIFGAIAARLRIGGPPRGVFWNLFEVFLLFIRDQVARPAIGAHHHEHDAHGDHDDDHSAHVDAHGHVKEEDPNGHHHHDHNEWEQADRFVPLLWTLFFFVLLCNLCGMLPWVGSPTGSFSVTLALAFTTFFFVVISGMKQFGFLGFFANQVPSMDLPLPLAILLKPMIFAIEMLGLVIKHAVLAVRLLANMVAGHLVILAFLGISFGAQAALNFTGPDGAVGWQWYLAATISILGVTAVSLLELFVAFLQAYVFTFLSALFIGAAVHKH